MLEDITMVNKIKTLIDQAGTNPHQVSRRTGITYRIVLGLYQKDVISPDTKIGTLWLIADALGVGVDDLYTVQEVHS